MTLLYISSILFLLFMSGVFSASETALFYLSQETIESIKKNNPRKWGIIITLLRNPQKLLTTILICNLFVNISAALVTEMLVKNRIIATFLITILIIIFGEAAPKSLAIKASKNIALFISPFIYFLAKIFSSITKVIQLISKGLVIIVSNSFYRKIKEPTNYQLNEVIPLIEEAKDSDLITEEELTILEHIVNFTKLELLHLLTPRNKIFSLSSETVLSDALNTIKEKKYSRIPIWEENEDNIIGVLYVKDIATVKIYKKRKIKSYANILKKPMFVPDSITPQELLQKLQEGDNHMAFVINEYGDMIGLLTFEDIVEKIVGEIIDKDDIKPMYHIFDPNTIEIQGSIELSEFNEIFSVNLSDNEAATVAGFLLNRIRKIPKAGEVFIFNNLKFTITEASINKIEKITVTRIKKRKKS